MINTKKDIKCPPKRKDASRPPSTAGGVDLVLFEMSCQKEQTKRHPQRTDCYSEKVRNVMPKRTNKAPSSEDGLLFRESKKSSNDAKPPSAAGRSAGSRPRFRQEHMEQARKLRAVFRACGSGPSKDKKKDLLKCAVVLAGIEKQIVEWMTERKKNVYENCNGDEVEPFDRIEEVVRALHFYWVEEDGDMRDRKSDLTTRILNISHFGNKFSSIEEWKERRRFHGCMNDAQAYPDICPRCHETIDPGTGTSTKKGNLICDLCEESRRLKAKVKAGWLVLASCKCPRCGVIEPGMSYLQPGQAPILPRQCMECDDRGERGRESCGHLR